ncbi:hypothetical protein [Saudi moumouvirus]|nr:hypothetical protein [Saudi moumouvirus]
MDNLIKNKLDSFDYKFIKNLVISSNSDESLQEKVVDLYLYLGLSELINKYIDIYNWKNIVEKSKADQRYVYVLLCCYKNYAIELEILEQIVPEIISQAKAGNALAQSNLGYLYNYGIVVECNNYTSIYYYQKAAEQNLRYGLFNYAVNGLHHDKELLKYIKIAHKNFDPIASYKLSQYYNDHGKKEKSLKYLTESAKNHYEFAQLFLGNYYKNINIKEAIHWYTLGAKQENLDCIQKLIKIYSETQPNTQKHTYWTLKHDKIKNNTFKIRKIDKNLFKNNIKINYEPVNVIKN